tara:strand:- start:1989 stop:2462 length:474 start_codon:yes stop_codon:yes gene_type:complete
MKIQINKYDLTRGMAKKFLSNKLEGIWHTGIMIDDIEYFYGDGIQKMPNTEFIKLQGGLFPYETYDYGETTKTMEEINIFLNQNEHLYKVDSYNIISHNCNHFTNNFCKFLVNKEIPQEIVDQAKNIVDSMNSFIGVFFKQASEEFHKANCKLITKN